MEADVWYLRVCFGILFVERSALIFQFEFIKCLATARYLIHLDDNKSHRQQGSLIDIVNY